jgi:hypothetical protein
MSSCFAGDQLCADRAAGAADDTAVGYLTRLATSAPGVI